MVLGPTDRMVCVLQVPAYRFYCHLHPKKRVSQLDIFCNIMYQYVRTDHAAVRKIYPSATLCQPILTVIFLRRIPKVAASIARKIVMSYRTSPVHLPVHCSSL